MWKKNVFWLYVIISNLYHIGVLIEIFRSSSKYHTCKYLYKLYIYVFIAVWSLWDSEVYHKVLDMCKLECTLVDELACQLKVLKVTYYGSEVTAR